MDNSDKDSLSIIDKSPSSKNDNVFVPKKSSTFWVLVRDKSNQIPIFEKTWTSDHLYRISLSSGKEQLIKCYFELNDSFLFCFKVAEA
jgi:hypothetical protein